MSSTKKLSINTCLNLAGQVLPLLFGVAVIPALADRLGGERFAMLGLAWTLVGVFSLFDFGLGRAVTHAVSELIAHNRLSDINPTVSSAVLAAAVLGVGAGGSIWLSSPLLTRLLRINSIPVDETTWALRMVALGLPLVTAMSALRGYFESVSRFQLINLHRIAIGVGSFLIPWGVVRSTQNIAWIVFSLILIRFLSLCHQLWYARRIDSICISTTHFSRSGLVSLFGFGGWMTVSNLVGSIMVYLDRFILGTMVGLADLVYYITPMDMLVRALVIPNSLVGALFPIATQEIHSQGGQIKTLYRKTLIMLGALVVPSALVGWMFAPNLLQAWLGAEYVQKATLVTRLLIIGVAASALSLIPFSLVQAAGKPKLTGIMHLAEMPVYLLVLYVFVSKWGIVGAAAAWMLRAVVDAVVLFAIWGIVCKGNIAKQADPVKV